MNKLRILLAEDHQTVREGLRMIIKAQPDMEIVAEAADGEEAIRYARTLKPNVVVMDISMPGMNGLKATKKLVAIDPDIKVLTLTRHKDSGYLEEMLRAGASGFVLKQSASEELLRAIRAVSAGQNYLDPAVTESVVSSYGAPSPGKKTRKTTLSEREEEVTKLIAWGYSNKEIAAKLKVSVKTVEAHKANSMKKLGVTSRIDIVRYAVVQGWLEQT